MTAADIDRELARDVTIGTGKLAGRGVYAARDFKQGELVVAYDLRALTQEEFDDLAPEEREWTHSFHGKIYLFPEPERYVNHSDDPSTYPDHARGGDVALRAIRKGEAITIDDRIELQRELDTFLEAYETALDSRDFDTIAPLIADDATYWSPDGTCEGKAAVQSALEVAWLSTGHVKYSRRDIEWIAANYWASACTSTLVADGIPAWRATNVLRRLDGSWRITHEHLSSAR
jgi:ketosteroid isomerase-like protein